MAYPLPVRRIGWSTGHLEAEVTVDAFLDLQCPYSRKAWVKLNHLLERPNTPPFRLRVLIFTVSHHRQGWDLNKAAYALSHCFDKPWRDVVDRFYKRQGEFTNDEFEDKTHRQLEERLAAVAHEDFQVEPDAFLERLRSDYVFRMSKETGRLAAARSVWVAPTFLINDFPADGLSSQSSIDEWAELLCRDRC